MLSKNVLNEQLRPRYKSVRLGGIYILNMPYKSCISFTRGRYDDRDPLTTPALTPHPQNQAGIEMERDHHALTASQPPAANVELDLCSLHHSPCPELPSMAPQNNMGYKNISCQLISYFMYFINKEDETSTFRVRFFLPLPLANRTHLGWKVGNGGVSGWEKLLVEGNEVRCGPF